jgi:hypothetical protein
MAYIHGYETATASLQDFGQMAWCTICDACKDFLRANRNLEPDTIHLTTAIEKAIAERMRVHNKFTGDSIRGVTKILGMTPIWDAEKFLLERRAA